MVVEVPVQTTLFRLLPTQLQEGQEVPVCVVLFTQGVNEQQSLADTYVCLSLSLVRNFPFHWMCVQGYKTIGGLDNQTCEHAKILHGIGTCTSSRDS